MDLCDFEASLSYERKKKNPRPVIKPALTDLLENCMKFPTPIPDGSQLSVMSSPGNMMPSSALYGAPEHR